VGAKFCKWPKLFELCPKHFSREEKLCPWLRACSQPEPILSTFENFYLNESWGLRGPQAGADPAVKVRGLGYLSNIWKSRLITGSLL